MLQASLSERQGIYRLEGSVVVFVKDEINCVTRLDLHVSSVECIWFEIRLRLIIRNTYMDLFIFLRIVVSRFGKNLSSLLISH